MTLASRDPAVEPEIDTFSLILPLPYRVGLAVILAVWGWGVNLHVLHRHRVDVPYLIRYPARPSATHPPHHLSAYRLAAVLSVLLATSLPLFWAATRADPRRVRAYSWLPLGFLVAVAVVFVAPLRGVAAPGGRSRLLSTLRRVSVGGLAQDRDGKFGDVLLADVLTSYSRLGADLFVAVCIFFRAEESTVTAAVRPDRACGGAVAVPLVLAAPFAIRFRQCLIEYRRVARGTQQRESVGWGGQHLANAAKYATAFPVIAINALRAGPRGHAAGPALGRAWLAAVVLNSLYSFYWDVTKDWDLTLLLSRAHPSHHGRHHHNSQPHDHRHHHPWGLRKHLVFRGGDGSDGVAIYYAVIVLDLVLRCAWAVRLTGRLDRLSGLESGVFALEMLEVTRRWMWIFFRIETEWVRNVEANALGSTQEDLLLGDYQGGSEQEGED